MKVKFNAKYNTIAFYVIIVFSICILLILLAFRLDVFISLISKIMTAIAPVIWGFVIAYIMNPLVKKSEYFLDKFLGNKLFKDGKHEKMKRGIAITIASLISLFVIIALMAMAIPELTKSITTLINNMPDYMTSLYDSILLFLKKFPKVSSTVTDWVEDQFADIEKTVLSWIYDFRPTLEKYLTTLKDGVFNFLIGVKDFLLGYIVSLYLLYSKEQFLGQFKKFMYAILPSKANDLLIVKGTHANKIFSDFLVGKALDSLIIGMLCFTVLVIFGIPNAMLISFIVGITNMIPFFGPIIGAIPSLVLVLLTSPKKTLLFIIIVLVIQQFDGNILGPKILGNKLNLPTFWILFAIFFFGNLFGFIGMLAGVPIFAVIYTLTKEFVNERVRIKNINILKENIDDIAEESNEDDIL